MAVVFFTGFETGDGSEVNASVLGGTSTVQSVIKRTGGYALKCPGTDASVTTIVFFLNATKVVVCQYVQFVGSPDGTGGLIIEVSTGIVVRLVLSVNASGTLHLTDQSGTMGLVDIDGITTLVASTFYRIEVAWDLVAGGAITVLINGLTDINTTHSSDVTSDTTGGYQVAGNAAGAAFYFDDVAVATGTTTPLGIGQVIARQGIAGTPTYNAWTKNGAATAALCWSETPFSATKNCSDNLLGDAQTMLVGQFSLTGSASEGAQVVGVNDTVNAVKVGMIAKTAVAGNLNIRRRVGGADTDTTVAITTSDAYYQTAIFTDTTANLDAYEIGAKNDLIGTLETVEDMWMMVYYTPGPPIIAGQILM